jgi:hypothetical protein
VRGSGHQKNHGLGYRNDTVDCAPHNIVIRKSEFNGLAHVNIQLEADLDRTKSRIYSSSKMDNLGSAFGCGNLVDRPVRLLQMQRRVIEQPVDGR